MGGMIEVNDTLRITKAQGFPEELDLEQHLKTPYTLKDVEGKIFSFHDKPKIRIYKIPPVRNFLVEDIKGKWVYWGLIHIVAIEHDYGKEMTSGKFKIIHLNTPEEMKKAHDLIDRNPATNYFTDK